MIKGCVLLCIINKQNVVVVLTTSSIKYQIWSGNQPFFPNLQPKPSFILVGGSLLPILPPLFFCTSLAHPLSFVFLLFLFYFFFGRPVVYPQPEDPTVLFFFLIWPPSICNWCRATCLSTFCPYTLIPDPTLYLPILPIPLTLVPTLPRIVCSKAYRRPQRIFTEFPIITTSCKTILYVAFFFFFFLPM